MNTTPTRYPAVRDPDAGSKEDQATIATSLIASFLFAARETRTRCPGRLAEGEMNFAPMCEMSISLDWSPSSCTSTSRSILTQSVRRVPR